MHDPGWFIRRLRAMQARELIWRSSRMVRDNLPSGLRVSREAVLRKGAQLDDWADALDSFRKSRHRPVLLDRDRAQVISAERPQFVSDLVRVASKVADLTFWFPGYPEVSLSRPVDWNHDPITGVRYPSVSSNRINYRALPGDVAWLWRINRLQHLPWLAQAWLFTGDEFYSETAFQHLDSWIDQNRPGFGVAWCGSFEASLRAIAVSIALQGLRDAPQLTPKRFRTIVGVLAESARRCWVDRSRFSSANNHLIGEMAALATVAILFPELTGAQNWERRAIRTLTTEATKQVLADGVGAEQSVCYQMFTVELLHLVAALLAHRDGAAPDPLIGAITRSSSFLAAVVGDDDPAPRYGDDDEGFALRLGIQPARVLHDHLGIMAASGWCPSAGSEPYDSLDARWFAALAQSAPSRSSRPSSAAKPIGYGPSFFASDGGLVVLRSQNRRMTMDLGPLGYLSTAAHGHADALAVTLSMDGKDVIGDPGTGSYYGHPGWRTVMRGTRAHSTVCVDGQDQSVVGGPYLWLQRANVRTFGVDLALGIVDAQHDGYERLPGGVIHRRWLVAPPSERTHLVIDLITGQGRHLCQQTWPLHSSLDVEPIRGGHVISRGEAQVIRLEYAASIPLAVTAMKGNEETNIGWWSDPAEGRSPAWWLTAACAADLPVAMGTLFSPADSVANEGLSIRLSQNSIEAKWTEDGCSRIVTVDTAKSASVVSESLVQKAGRGKPT